MQLGLTRFPYLLRSLRPSLCIKSGCLPELKIVILLYSEEWKGTEERTLCSLWVSVIESFLYSRSSLGELLLHSYLSSSSVLWETLTSILSRVNVTIVMMIIVPQSWKPSVSREAAERVPEPPSHRLAVLVGERHRPRKRQSW